MPFFTLFKAWAIWEGSVSKLLPAENVEEEYGDAFFALGFARIECHYFVNNCFLEDNFILNNTDKIKDIPTFIVQGRYDVVCPPTSAWELYKKLERMLLEETEQYRSRHPLKINRKR